MHLANPPRRRSAFALSHAIITSLLFAPSLWAQATAGAGASAKPQTGTQTEEPTTLPVFEVRTDKDEGYLSTHAVTGSRTLERLKDTPNSISVMNRELMDDLNITTPSELLAYAVTGQPGDDTTATTPQHVFRGIVSNVQLRNNLKTLGALDAYSLERVEILRGPNSFLFGEGTAGGTMNMLTKQGQFRDFQKVNLLFGSYDLHRIEVDVNRRLHDKVAVRFDLAYQDEGGFVNHTKRNFKGAYGVVTYRPFRDTFINANGEKTVTRRTVADGILADAFDTTQRTGATTAYTATTGGRTLFAATGQTFNVVGQRRSSGTNAIVLDTSLLPREANYWGPNAHHNIDAESFNISVAQKVGENLNIQAAAARYKIFRHTRSNAGSSSAGIYLDTNPTLPGGATNPNLGQKFTEYYVTDLEHVEMIHDARLTVVYDLKLPVTTQKIMATGSLQDDIPDRRFYRTSEFVDPASPLFNGSLINANTLAAYVANNTTLNNNRFYRRYYLKDGDGARFTGNNLVAGTSKMIFDSPSDGATGRLSDRKFETPSVGFGVSGSYFKNRINTLIGWRRDAFIQRTLSRALYNHFTGLEYKVPETVVSPVKIYKNSINYGGVFHVAKFVSAYVNYAESVGLSAGFGGAQLIPGTLRGVAGGDGYEYGLRWSFLEGRIESNWTYYITNVLNQAASPGIPTAARNELAAIFTDINQSGGDWQQTKSSGLEFETIANVTKNWRLIWNIASNELATSNRYPALRSYQARAKEQSKPTPETDAFLLTVPDGTPLPGFTKTTSNLVTNYRFDEGVLKGFTFGGGFQYRAKTYRANFDFNRDGVNEEVWSPGYFLGNLMAAYRTKLMNRAVSINLNVNNILNKDYFISRGLGTGTWGGLTSFRIAIRADL
ncbi:MAG: TonB-dependent receptor plug domain-containing protein [Verrucomicrobia bacterium]|nr:TonB-dependent receptor plug domain-containing protein [Verrucomicrobiota bacterium]